MSARALGFGWQGGGTGSISGWAVASCEPSRPDTAKTAHKNAFLVLSGNIVISFLGKRVLRFGASNVSGNPFCLWRVGVTSSVCALVAARKSAVSRMLDNL